MMKRRNGIQETFSVVTLESLVPKDHYLRDVVRLVDFSFIYDLVAPLYSDVGAPSLDPVLVIKNAASRFYGGNRFGTEIVRTGQSEYGVSLVSRN